MRYRRYSLIDSQELAAVAIRVPSVFFSSRRRHTRYIGDWSSDVCSSDLGTCPADHAASGEVREQAVEHARDAQIGLVLAPGASLRLVGEAVRLPGDREAELLPAVLGDRPLAVEHLPAAVSEGGESHAGPEGGEGALALVHAVDAVEDAVGV